LAHERSVDSEGRGWLGQTKILAALIDRLQAASYRISSNENTTGTKKPRQGAVFFYHSNNS